MSDPRHEGLFAVLKTLPSDFRPYGEREREGPDCSCGCRYFVPLEHGLRYDWGVCHNQRSPRSGLLTFEHQGCSEFEDRGEGEAPHLDPHEPRGPVAAGASELNLLANLKARRSRLEEALACASDHWRFEDPVYRFYHQSFKVYAVQGQTEGIVRELSALLPGHPLNPWFLEIVEQGTARRFEPEHNQTWTASTRPMIEAFFHARFFLDMAVRYAHLQAPPSPLPSGYAALLYLFNLR